MKRSTALAALTAMLLGGCSSTVEGTGKPAEEPCTAGVCKPNAIFGQGMVSAFLVTTDRVYAAFEDTCVIYAADKPVTEARIIATDACYVTSIVSTSGGLFWTKVDPSTKKATFSWLPTDATRPIDLMSDLATPHTSVLAFEDTVYVGVSDGIARLDEAAPKLTPVVSGMQYAPIALRSWGDAIYFSDGLATIYRWHPGDAKAQALVEGAAVLDPLAMSTSDETFAVDDSGFYWFEYTVSGEGALSHAPLAGGKPETLFEAPGYPSGLAVDDGGVYWTEADDSLVPTRTTLHRTPKAALRTSSTVAALSGAAKGLQTTTEGLYLAASPSLSDFDVDSMRFRRFAGPLLIVSRDRLEQE
jgi:hypothetical protein